MRCDAGLMKACAQCLGNDDLRLIKAGLNVKTSNVALRGAVMEGPQMLEPHKKDSEGTLEPGETSHSQEYGRTTLTVPSLDCPEAVVAEIFLNDIKDVGGAICVVPHTAGASGWARSIVAGEGSLDNSRANAHTLYERERATYYKAGTVLLHRSVVEHALVLSLQAFRSCLCCTTLVLFLTVVLQRRLDTFCRETPVKPGGQQLTLSVILKLADAEHVQWDTWATPMAGIPRDYIAQMSVWQRNALPIAAPGDKYWTNDTLMAVAQRYAGMDMQPYIAAADIAGVAKL